MNEEEGSGGRNVEILTDPVEMIVALGGKPLTEKLGDEVGIAESRLGVIEGADVKLASAEEVGTGVTDALLEI